MNDVVLNVPLPSGTLVLFDPETLDHRRKAPRDWSSDRGELEREVAALHLAALPLSAGPGAALISVEEGTPPASADVVTARVRVKDQGLYLGDRSELPSSAWGRRRWNGWDWAFAAFLLSLIPFTVWLLGFDKDLLWLLGGMAVVFLVLLIPISIPFFKTGFGLVGRSAIPPKDYPDRMLRFEPGEYVVALQRRGTDGVRERISVWFGRKQ